MKKSELIKAIQETVKVSLKEALMDVGSIEEGGGMDRQSLVQQASMLGKKISTRVAFSSIPDGSLAVMVQNLEAIATKLQ